ncbi:pyridoxal-dependent decarboxylase [Flagellimonas aquimarina]|uniref:Pyridoxal-dependent decarboxylase n=2 Tax=Flagellimonas aquimarina TaxID=2201895 RepID=A0A316KZJ3_9FLAO|nr:pyridoxal-dependent decarboxylase [Allomuricauda koreensis]
MKMILEDLYSSKDFKQIGHELIDLFADHIQNTTLGTNPKTIRWNEPDKELSFWEDYLENEKEQDFFEEILNRTTHIHHPKYMGHQVAPTLPITALTAMVSSLLNNGMAVYEMGMSSNAIERIVTEKLCEKIGYGQQSSGFLTSGGTLANLTALLSARKAKVAHDVWNNGHTEPLGIMVCEEAHYCVDRAAKIMGLGEKGIIKVPADENFAMDTNKMEICYQKAKSEGINIFAIVGSAPSTATGAHDNLEKIQEFAQKNNLWFHVDGAHGGAAVFSKKYKGLLKGIEQADSVVIDGHKMLLMPAITTALLFKENSHARHTFSLKADYLMDAPEEDEWFNSGKRTFECTKNMMAMHWYIILKLYGEKVFDEFITRQYDLAKDFATIISNEPYFELATPPMSNILCFRYIGTHLSSNELNILNQAIRRELLEDGEFYLVQTKLNGKHYLRTTLMNPFTSMEHLNLLLEKIKNKAEKLLVKKTN